MPSLADLLDAQSKTAVQDILNRLDNGEVEPVGYDGHGAALYAWQVEPDARP